MLPQHVQSKRNTEHIVFRWHPWQTLSCTRRPYLDKISSTSIRLILDGGMGVLLLLLFYNYTVCMWVTVQYVVSLLFVLCLSFFVRSSYSFYVLLFVSGVSLFLCFVFYFVCPVFFVLFYILFLLMYSCFFSICVQVYWPLPPGGNPNCSS